MLHSRILLRRSASTAFAIRRRLPLGTSEDRPLPGGHDTQRLEIGVAEERPLVGVIMGSKSDWDTMSHADAVLDRVRVPHECLRRFRTPHTGLDGRIRNDGGGARPRSDHRRGRRRRAPAGDGRRADGAAGDWRAGAEQGAQRPRLAAVDRPDAEGRPGGDGRDRRVRRRQRRAARNRHPVELTPRPAREAAGVPRPAPPTRFGGRRC